MAHQIFVNVPVKDLTRSMDFFKALGYTFNMQFTNEQAACTIVSDNIYIMLVTEPFFKTFTNKAIADAAQGTEVINALAVQTRAEVDEVADKAFAAGATASKEPVDYGWMYSRSFQDPDGHIWEYFYMDMSAMPTA